MPTKFVLALVLVAALFLIMRNGENNAAAGQATNPVEQGLAGVDSVLQEGLSQDTHHTISDGLNGSLAESAEFLSAVETELQAIAE
jgi:hypothetical protein